MRADVLICIVMCQVRTPTGARCSRPPRGDKPATHFNTYMRPSGHSEGVVQRDVKSLVGSGGHEGRGS